MFITENPIIDSPYITPENSPYFSGMKAAVIDIETTGLSSSKDMIFLIGVLSDSEDGLKVTQFLASDYEDEASVLLSFFDFIKDTDIYLNYNGTSFDIPFINKRCEKLGISKRLEICRSVDYLRIFKASYLPELLPDMKLKTLEPLAGVNRKDRASGKECISLYSDFVRKNDRTAGRKVLLHNFEDLSCFPHLNRLMGKIDIHSAMGKTGFPVKSGKHIFFVQSIKKNASCIKVSGFVPGCSIDIDVYEDLFTLKADSRNDIFSLEIFSDACFPDRTPGCREINMLVKDILSSQTY
ncbi:MAG: ribonuclease H-like domain-containing protein [Bacillota bacterium]|nr:ribonuclease H-like domain-containing protein [Bacillota bacterium]